MGLPRREADHPPRADPLRGFGGRMVLFGFGMMQLGCALTLLAIMIPFAVIAFAILWALVTGPA